MTQTTIDVTVRLTLEELERRLSPDQLRALLGGLALVVNAQHDQDTTPLLIEKHRKALERLAIQEPGETEPKP